MLRVILRGNALLRRTITYIPHTFPVDKYEELVCSGCKKEMQKCECDDIMSDPTHPLNPIMPLSPFNPINHSNILPVSVIPPTIQSEPALAKEDTLYDDGYDS